MNGISSRRHQISCRFFKRVFQVFHYWFQLKFSDVKVFNKCALFWGGQSPAHTSKRIEVPARNSGNEFANHSTVFMTNIPKLRENIQSNCLKRRLDSMFRLGGLFRCQGKVRNFSIIFRVLIWNHGFDSIRSSNSPTGNWVRDVRAQSELWNFSFKCHSVTFC